MGWSAECMARFGLFDAQGGDDVAGVGLLYLLALVRVHAHEASHALLLAGNRVQNGRTRLQHARINADEYQLAHVGVRHHLEGERAERIVVRGRSFLGFSAHFQIFVGQHGLNGGISGGEGR